MLKKEYSKLIKVIIDDLRNCISYIQNQDNDLLCLMEQYLKVDKERRVKLLESIKNCINGKPYDNPFDLYNHYSQNDIDKLEKILVDFCLQMQIAQKQVIVFSKTIELINTLNEKTYGRLIDSWRKNYLEELFITVANDVYFYIGQQIINEKKRW